MTLVEYFKQRFLYLMEKEDMLGDVPWHGAAKIKVDRSYDEIENIRAMRPPNLAINPGTQFIEPEPKEITGDQIRMDRRRRAQHAERIAKKNDDIFNSNSSMNTVEDIRAGPGFGANRK